MSALRTLFPMLATCLILSGDCLADDSRPNVLFIAVDDMNDWVGCLGGYPGKVHTPNIDKLAARGMLFTNAHCPAPVCNPSRTAILTGLRPSTTGIYDNGAWWRPALPDAVSLPESFQRNGYLVAGGGKVFHHTPGFNPPGQWDEYFQQVFDDPWHRPGSLESLPVKGIHWPDGFPLNNLPNVKNGKRPPANPKEFDWGPMAKADSEMGDGQLIGWAQKFLRQKHEAPFFLATGIFRPHLPWYAPRKYFDLYPLEEVVLPSVPADDLDDIPEAGRKIAAYRGNEWEYLKANHHWKKAVQAYLASISFADAMVGLLIDELELSPYAENTIVILWSDHGWHLGEKHHWHKFTLWEEATRVPLIVNVPGLTQLGQTCDRAVSLIDLYPTLSELCALQAPENLDGQSLVPLLKDPAAQPNRTALITHGRGNHAVRSRSFRYIRYADGSEELYDHRVDPNEWTNVAGEDRAVAIKARLRKSLPSADASPAPRKSRYLFDPQSYSWTEKRQQ
ncbi:MAG: sulfatase [Planctomycetaceae bacterium]|nr:sulfatase [Planctomycetaceae bacterium]